MTGVDLADVAVAQAKKNAEALKPGGLLVAEGFANPPKQVGFQTEELARAFTRLRIVRDETVEDYPAWYLPEKRPWCGLWRRSHNNQPARATQAGVSADPHDATTLTHKHAAIFCRNRRLLRILLSRSSGVE